VDARTEIHFHLLPELDDGPSTMEDSLQLARLASQDRTSTIISTPHICDVELDELEGRLGELRVELDRHRIPLRILCGGELAPKDIGRLSNSELDGVAHGPDPARWVLLESPFRKGTDEFATAAVELRRRGFGLVVAHPERSQALDRGFGEVIGRELKAGSWLQVNSSSLTGSYGEETRMAALELLARHDKVVVSSDAHGRTRPPMLSRAAVIARSAGLSAERVCRAVDKDAPRLVKFGIFPPDALSQAHGLERPG
jgi:protein-tyrosine phosphatase